MLKASVFLAATFVSYVTFERQRISLTSYTISSDKVSRPYKLVQLSDLHGHVFVRDNQRLIKKVQALQPDCICLTGDLITSTKASGDRVIDLIKRLNVTCPIYYIRGNHELAIENYVDWVDAYEKALQTCGVIILKNEAVSLGELMIYGIEVPLSAYRYVPSALLPSRHSQNESDYLSCAPKTTEFSVLLSHTPFLESYYLEKQYDVILTGHVHGGIIQIPGVGGLLSPERTFFPKFSQGVYKLHESRLIVNRGLGCGKSLPIRVNNPPEIVEVIIVPSEEKLKQI